MFSWRKLLLIACFFADVANAATAKAQPAIAKSKAKLLTFPSESRSLETPDIAISGIASDADRLYFVVSDRSHIVVTPFHGLKTTREESFGNIVASARYPLADQPPLTTWQGLVYDNGRLLLLDGQGLRLLSMNTTDFALIARRSIAWDLIKPAADSKGEPTRSETDQLRSRFRREFQKVGDVKLSGMAHLSSGKNAKYLVATRLAGFPIVMMNCSGEDGSMCYLERACEVPKISDLLPASISGIAFSKKRNQLLIGDRANNRILVFNYKSCFDMTRASTIEIPPKIKSLSNIYIDGDDRLWTVSSTADDYLNASAYVWEPKDW